jgi:hypothetical protein
VCPKPKAIAWDTVLHFFERRERSVECEGLENLPFMFLEEFRRLAVDVEMGAER